MRFKTLLIPAGLMLVMALGACANTESTESTATGNSVGLDKNAKAASCCPEMDKAHCAAAKAAGACEGSKASCDAAKAACEEGAKVAPKTDS